MKDVYIQDLFFAKTDPNAIIPTKRSEDSGYDLYACSTETIVIEPCSTELIDTGIATAVSEDWFIKLFDKGGMGSLGIVTGAGVVDSGYRNSIFVPLINTNMGKWSIITNQTEEEVKQSTCFDFKDNKFKKLDCLDNYYCNMNIIGKEYCIVKYLNKAITQFVVLPVPKLSAQEISWDELKSIPSSRGMGSRGSSGK